ncbi:MAG TPA: DMT family transporter [Anaerolineales bacterium]|nr:DMT family transporter [Anaerolineales bacterium]HLO33913.1 DMT family transporter [Anaerolineales bacterium]
MNLKAILKAIFAVTVWGASFVATKIALQFVVPSTVVWLRFTMGVAILGVAVILNKQFSLPQGKDWGYFALLGFLGITFHQWLQSTGLLTAQATTTAWIITTTPIFIALLGLIILRESLAWYQVIGIILATFGVLVIVTKGNLLSLAGGRLSTPGDFLVLISAVNWAVFSTLSRPGLKKHPATLMMFYVMSFGWVFTTVLFFAGSGIKQIPSIPWDGWVAITFLGVFCSGIAYVFWYDAMKVLPVAQTGAFLYLEPMITVVVAALVIREAILLATFVGGITILIGVWLVNRPTQSLQVTEEAPTS